jgi:hypothetical protein
MSDLGLQSSNIDQDAIAIDDTALQVVDAPRTRHHTCPAFKGVCVMAHAPLVPSLNEDVHFVLCDFGRAGLADVETDPAEADVTTIVQNLLHGQYERPMRVIAINAEEGWSRDVSESIAAKVRDVAEHEDRDLTSGTLDFIEAHIGRVRQPTLPLW